MQLKSQSSRAHDRNATGPKGRPVPGACALRWKMRRTIWAAVAIALLLFGTARSALAVEASELLVPQFSAEQHGLTRAWFFQIPAIGGRSHLTHVVQDDGMLFAQTS